MDKLLDLITSLTSGLNDVVTNMFAILYGSTFKAMLNSTADNIMKGHADILTTLYSTIIPIGLMIMFIAFVTKIMEMGIEQQFSIDKFLKDFILFILVLMFLDNGVNTSKTGWIQKAYDYTISISDEIVSSDALSSAMDNSNIKNGLDDLTDSSTEEDGTKKNIFQKIWDKVHEAVSSVINTALNIIIFSIGYSIVLIFVFAVSLYRAVKIGIYTVLAPLGIASCYSKGSAGLVYFKKLFALFLQYPVILISSYITIKVGGSSTGATNAVLAIFLIISCLLSSESKAKELLR